MYSQSKSKAFLKQNKSKEWITCIFIAYGHTSNILKIYN